MFEEIDVISPPSSTSRGEGWRLPLVLPWNGRIPFDVETTLPRERQVGEGASLVLMLIGILAQARQVSSECERRWLAKRKTAT